LADDESKVEPVQEENPPCETKTPTQQELIEQKDRKLAELTDTVKRLQAEFDNHKKRTEREWSERAKMATKVLMTELLPVLDSFDKAIEDAKKNQNAASMRRGLEGVYRQLVQILQKEGLRQIKADGVFDPFMHEALMREEREGAEDGRILEVFQKGYSLNGESIRTSKVKVAKKKEIMETPQEEPERNHDNHINQVTDEKNDSEER